MGVQRMFVAVTCIDSLKVGLKETCIQFDGNYDYHINPSLPYDEGEDWLYAYSKIREYRETCDAKGMAVEEVSLETFSRHPKKMKSVDIRFCDLGYTVSLGCTKGDKEILHNVHGYFLPSQLIAIMGPSGAGKSTLLDVLSGYKVTGVKGAILVNGKERDLNEFRRVSCYIQQDDRLQPLLTVKENMMIAADLKLPSKITYKEKQETINEILNTLGLWESEHTRTERLSGGQKKRLSIALELINNPHVMFLDEPTTGLDSSSCSQCLSLLKVLAAQGRTIICTIHQPSATLFQKFDQVYILSRGECLYQGSAGNMMPFLQTAGYPCPKYHNPADYVIELACGDYGEDKITKLVEATQNGRSIEWFENPDMIPPVAESVPRKFTFLPRCRGGLQVTSPWNQVCVLLKRGFIKVRRDQTLTHMRLMVNIITGVMLGTLWLQVGEDGSRVLDNYNLLFSILIHHVMTTMMLTILTSIFLIYLNLFGSSVMLLLDCVAGIAVSSANVDTIVNFVAVPMEMSILTKEHFNRWYSLKSYYISVNIVDIPVSTVCCILFSAIIYTMSGQPADMNRFFMFTTISLLVVYIAQSIGFMIGAVFNVVNGTFIGPTLVVPMMMFSGFGVTIRDIPDYLKWGTYISYLKYSLEGYIGAIYGYSRQTLPCNEFYCHYKYPNKFLREIAMRGDQFWNDIIALSVTLVITRVAAYVLLRWKIQSMR